MTHGTEYPKLCPTCGRPVQELRFGVPFTQLQALIIDRINRRPGIPAKDILDKNPLTIKAHIWQINQKLGEIGKRIHGSRWGYRLEARW